MFCEFDWRYSSTRKVLEALSDGITVDAQAVQEEWEVEDAREYEDDLCGVAFVAAQAYISGVVADFNRARPSMPAVGKHELLKTFNPTVADTKLTQLQLCDTMANYYKHRDEWDDWDHPLAARTTSLLRVAGFSKEDLYLCTCVAALLIGTQEFRSFVPLASLLSKWRTAVIASLKP